MTIWTANTERSSMRELLLRLRAPSSSRRSTFKLRSKEQGNMILLAPRSVGWWHQQHSWVLMTKLKVLLAWPGLDERRGVQENISMRSRGVRRAQPEGTVETECWYPPVPPNSSQGIDFIQFLKVCFHSFQPVLSLGMVLAGVSPRALLCISSGKRTESVLHL